MEVVLGRPRRRGGGTLQLIRRNPRGEVVLYDPIAEKVSVKTSKSTTHQQHQSRPRPWTDALTTRSLRKVATVRHGFSGVQNEGDDAIYAEICPTCGHMTEPHHGSKPGGHASTSDPLKSSFHPSYFRLLAKSDSETTSRVNSPVNSDDEEGRASVDGLPLYLFSLGYLKRFFCEIKSLGSGAKGQVKLYQHVLDNVQLGLYAIKLIPCGHSREWLQKVLSEATLLQQLRHPNIIAYHHAFLDHLRIVRSGFGPKVPTLCLLMDYANGSDLDQYLQNITKQGKHGSESSLLWKNPGELDRPFLPLRTILALFEDICVGLNHLHSNNICHLDLKAQNVLLMYDLDTPLSDSSSVPRAMLSDMGSCELLANASQGLPGDQRIRSGNTGTIEFLPPENLKMDPLTGRLWPLDKRADVWAAGCILHLLLFGRLMWSQIDDVDSLGDEIRAYPGFQAAQCQFQGADSHHLVKLTELLSTLLSHDLGMRPTISKVLSAVQTIRSQVLLDDDLLSTSSSKESYSSHAKSGRIFETFGDDPDATASDYDQSTSTTWNQSLVLRPAQKVRNIHFTKARLRSGPDQVLGSILRHGEKAALLVLLFVTCHAMDRAVCGTGQVQRISNLVHLALFLVSAGASFRIVPSWLVPLIHISIIRAWQWAGIGTYTKVMCHTS